MSLVHTLSRSRGRRRPLRAATVRRPRLRLLLAAAFLVAVLGAGWAWLRDSSFVRVTDVEVVGAKSSAEPRIRAALDAAGRGMTTLHVRESDLEQAVAGFPSIAAVRARTDFPHRLVIEVVERRAAAVIALGDERLAVTGSGLLLRDVAPPSGLPEVTVDGALSAARVQDRRTLSALAVAAAAPPALRRRTARVVYGPRGITAELDGGPPLIFGTGDDAALKWASAARVLADPSAAGAMYLDLRVPGRVAAGGLGPVAAETAPVDPSAGTATAPATAVPTVTAEPSPDPQP
jgi:cell division protein FtsQ